jgi:hypothetical protein
VELYNYLSELLGWDFMGNFRQLLNLGQRERNRGINPQLYSDPDTQDILVILTFMEDLCVDGLKIPVFNNDLRYNQDTLKTHQRREVGDLWDIVKVYRFFRVFNNYGKESARNDEVIPHEKDKLEQAARNAFRNAQKHHEIKTQDVRTYQIYQETDLVGVTRTKVQFLRRTRPAATLPEIVESLRYSSKMYRPRFIKGLATRRKKRKLNSE